MIQEIAKRRKFLGLMMAAGACVVVTRDLCGQGTPRKRRANPDGSSDEDAPVPGNAESRKSALEENEKDVKKKVERLFQLATELKEEADKTDAVKVLSVAMLKKTEEIEKLAKDIRARAKG
jgi:peptidoglycan hydrolase CwlO-like protein